MHEERENAENHAHGLKQTTSDVDILLTAQGLEQFRQAFVGSAYDPVRNKRRRYVDRLNGIQVDVIVTGHYAGRDGPGPVAFPDSQESSEGIDSIRVLTLPNLIQLKLAARRYRHLGDVAHLIRIHDLDESFLEKLHPSVHADYLKCLDEKRREEEFEALQI